MRYEKRNQNVIILSMFSMQIFAHMLIWLRLYLVTNESHLSMHISNTYILRYPWYRMIIARQFYGIECFVCSTSRLGHLPLMMSIIIDEIRREKKWCFLKMLLIMIISFIRKRLFNPFCTLPFFIGLCMLIPTFLT